MDDSSFHILNSVSRIHEMSLQANDSSDERELSTPSIAFLGKVFQKTENNWEQIEYFYIEGAENVHGELFLILNT